MRCTLASRCDARYRDRRRLLPRARDHFLGLTMSFAGPRAPGTPIRVVIVDDHAIVRKGIRAFLETAPDISVIGEADNGASGVALATELKPDVAVMDIMMPGLDGVAATTAIRRDSPSTEV